MKKFLPLLLGLIFFPLSASAVDPASFTSKLPGVQLWGIGVDQSKYPSETFAEVNEFTRYCDGKRSLYVSSIDVAVPCKSKWIDKYTYNIFLLSTDKRLDGMVIVSKNPIGPRVKSASISNAELISLKREENKLSSTFATDAKRKYIESLSENDNELRTLREKPELYETWISQIKTASVYRQFAGQRYKLPTAHGSFFISSIGLDLNVGGWNLKNAVFQKTNGKLIEVGAFYGCILGFRDLNGDGIPEVFTRSCDEAVATSYQYWSIADNIEVLVSVVR